MPRVLVWTEWYWPALGGLQLAMAEMLPALKAGGLEIEVVTTAFEGALNEEIIRDIPVHRVDVPVDRSAANLDRLMTSSARLRQIVQRFQPELIVLLQPMALLIFYQAAYRTHPAPSVYCIRDNLASLWGADHWIGQRIRACDYVVSNSETVLKVAREVMPEIVLRSGVLYNTLAAPTLSPAPLPWQPPVLLCMGRLVEQKGFDIALHAFARIAGCFPSLRMVISGDGPDRLALEALAGSLDLGGRVDFTGWIPPEDVPAAINRATVVLVPSRHEGLPQISVQAAHMSRPVVGSAVDGLLEVVVDGETGMLLPPGDQVALADALARLLSNPDAAEAMGQAAHQRAVAQFDSAASIHRYGELFRRVAAGQGGGS